VKFFFDNNLAPKLARGLNQMVEPEHHVVHLKDGFPGDVEDVVWMRISRNPHEIQAWREAGLTIFFLKPGWTNLAFWEQANKFTKCLPHLLKEAERAERGSAFVVAVNGKIEKLG